MSHDLNILIFSTFAYFKTNLLMVYIDPPYNTGNDFVYKDDFADTINDYMQKTGQLDEEGKALSTNPKTSGRFHSNWLNMMYPRLMLAKNLLHEDGAMFVSIDDSEVNNLREIMNEVFGVNNFLAQFIWKARQFTDTRSKKNISTDHEYLLAYSKSSNCILNGVDRDETKFSNPDEDSRGPWMSRSILGLATIDQRPNLHYNLINPENGNVYPPNPSSGWRYSEERMVEMIKEGRIIFPKKIDGRPREKKFRNEMQNDKIAFRSVIDDIYTANGTQEVRDIFESDLFSFPKPSTLIKRICTQITNEKNDDIIIDFFSGSATTANAVLDLNGEDNGSRKFIMVQLPEKTSQNSEASRSGYKTIADIGKERIRRVIKKLNEEDNNENNQDRGFKVLKLSESNLIKWDISESSNLENLEKQLQLFTDPLQEGWKVEDLLLEVMIWEGYSLTAKIEKTKAGQNTFISVTDKSMEYKLYCCFDKKLDFTMKQFSEIGFTKEDVVIFLDSSLTDAVKSRLSDLCRLKVV